MKATLGPGEQASEADRRSTVTGRLTLVEELLLRDRPAGMAAATLAWLSGEAGMERGMCAVRERTGNRLNGLSAHGLAGYRVETFHLDPGDREDPLAPVLDGDAPVFFDEPTCRTLGPSRLPPRMKPFWAVPLGCNGSRDAGLLLASGPDIDEAELEWAGNLLGTRLSAHAALTLREDATTLRTECRRLEKILDAVPDPVLLVDADDRLLYANADAEKLLVAGDRANEGRRRAVSLNNMMFSAASAPSDSKDTGRRELLLVNPVDGSDLTFELLSTPVETPREGARLSILRDVTDLGRAVKELEANYERLREAETRTRAERDRLELVLGSVADPVLVTDDQGDILIMNPPAERLFTLQGSPGSDASRRVRANHAVLSSFLGNLRAQGGRRYTSHINCTDPTTGEALTMNATAGQVASDRGQDAAVVTTLHEIGEAIEKAMLYDKIKHHSEELEARVQEATSELAAQNELLRRKALELEEASAMKSQFLANVSHELRTPLNVILYYATLLRDGVYGGLGNLPQEKLEKVESNAEHLAKLISEVLDFTRIEAGKLRIQPEEFDLEELVDEVGQELEALIDDSGLAVTLSVSPELPELRTDRGKVKQVLVNLLSNALKFTPGGSVRLEAGPARPHHVAIAVRDTGIGISPERRRTIFEPFSHSNPSSEGPAQGSGLGLSICKRLAAALGGRLELESAEGDGSTFTLRIPTRAPESLS